MKEDEDKHSDKKITTIYILQEILDFSKKYKVNLSQWINREFSNQFLSIATKKDKIKALQAEIKEVESRLDDVSKSLTNHEVRYICTVMPRMRDGKELSSMWRYFNNQYKRNFTLNEFESLVNFHEEQAVIRVKKAIEMRNKEIKEWRKKHGKAR